MVVPYEKFSPPHGKLLSATDFFPLAAAWIFAFITSGFAPHRSNKILKPSKVV
jgi:hypothetical protein